MKASQNDMMFKVTDVLSFLINCPPAATKFKALLDIDKGIRDAVNKVYSISRKLGIDCPEDIRHVEKVLRDAAQNAREELAALVDKYASQY